MTTIEAVYQNGVFKPLAPVKLVENERVRLVVEQEDSAAAAEVQAWLADIRELQQAIIAEHGGPLPDSTLLIAEDRRRDV
jgi:predicted DNA-binding antitoxin AbrB/MazE fold protein